MCRVCLVFTTLYTSIHNRLIIFYRQFIALIFTLLLIESLYLEFVGRPKMEKRAWIFNRWATPV